MKAHNKELTVYISPTTFVVITVCLLMLPVSMRYRLLLFGEKTEGVVVPTHMAVFNKTISAYPHRGAIIRFNADSSTYQLVGPENTHYDVGESVTVIYSPHNPTNCVVYSFSGLFLDVRLAVSVPLLVVWLAFYFVFGAKPKSKESGLTNINKH